MGIYYTFSLKSSPNYIAQAPFFTLLITSSAFVIFPAIIKGIFPLIINEWLIEYIYIKIPCVAVAIFATVYILSVLIISPSNPNY